MLKTHQKGLRFLLDKFRIDSTKRVQAAFNSTHQASNWWVIPEIQAGWNKQISGDAEIGYEEYLIENLFSKSKNLSLLSIGCGVGNHAIRFAQSANFSQVVGIDIAKNSIALANEKVKELGLDNCTFRFHDILKNPVEESFDVILFHSSLHHFPDIGGFLENRVLPILKEGGHLILFEFVGPNRHQWTKEQLRRSTQLLRAIPHKWRKTRLPFYIKNRVYRPGIWRMLLADPSESIDSESIQSQIHKKFKVIEESPLGGNLAHLIFKDIAHHFADMNEEQRQIFTRIISAEKEFVDNQRLSDFIFGVYQKLK